jgi:hypothetical protein
VFDALLPPGGTAPARDVLIDMPAGPYNDSRRSFIHGDMKLTISNGTRFELYDLASDPEERKNLWGAPAAEGDGDGGGRAPTRAQQIETYYEAQKMRLREVKVTGKRK